MPPDHGHANRRFDDGEFKLAGNGEGVSREDAGLGSRLRRRLVRLGRNAARRLILPPLVQAILPTNAPASDEDSGEGSFAEVERHRVVDDDAYSERYETLWQALTKEGREDALLHPYPGDLPYDENLAFAELVDDIGGLDEVEDYLNDCLQNVGEDSPP